MYLKDHSNKKGQYYLASETVAKGLQLLRRTMERAIDDLVRAGLAAKEQHW